jgi:hypothetical protein
MGNSFSGFFFCLELLDDSLVINHYGKFDGWRVRHRKSQADDDDRDRYGPNTSFVCLVGN